MGGSVHVYVGRCRYGFGGRGKENVGTTVEEGKSLYISVHDTLASGRQTCRGLFARIACIVVCINFVTAEINHEVSRLSLVLSPAPNWIDRVYLCGS